MTYKAGNKGRGRRDWKGKDVRSCGTAEDIDRNVATSGSDKKWLPDPKVATFRLISSAVPQLLTPFLFLSYHHHTIARTVPDDLPTSSWNEQIAMAQLAMDWKLSRISEGYDATVFDPENYRKMEREEKMLRPYKNGGKWGHCRIYEKEVLHAGICLIEPELFRGSDPNKVFNQEIELIHDLVEPIEVSDLNLQLGDKCKIWAGEGPDHIIAQTGHSTYWAWFALSKPLTPLASQIPTNFITISILWELGLRYGRHNPHGQDVKDRRDEKEVQNDILQETFINTTAGWANLLLLSSSRPNGRPHTCKLYSSMPIFTIELEPWRLRGARILWRGRPQGATPVAHSVPLSQLNEATPNSTHA
ncbi:hypothetical protein BYT27DRAFT_7208447 [Phlegmacium glaucopus]|nr:hypothetical protein BYT27DRAFT_7208447 [Phlegmacium glaucopus]